MGSQISVGTNRVSVGTNQVSVDTNWVSETINRVSVGTNRVSGTNQVLVATNWVLVATNQISVDTNRVPMGTNWVSVATNRISVGTNWMVLGKGGRSEKAEILSTRPHRNSDMECLPTVHEDLFPSSALQNEIKETYNTNQPLSKANSQETSRQGPVGAMAFVSCRDERKGREK